MPWIVLFVSAALEAVWATALGASDGFREATPTVVFVVALAASMATLAYVARHIPMSVAYAIWSGAGAALTVGWAMTTGHETAAPLKIVFLIGIIGCIVGLRLLEPHPAEHTAGQE